MKKRLDTRFPAARIKKIMQADEDVGKIAMAVPLLVSKALELFLQDLCGHTYDITLKRGAKTMNSFHLKQCIQSCNVFDFLKDVVSRVPDLGGAASTAKRRMVTKEDDTDDDVKRSNMHEAAQTNGSGRGRGRGRGRGHGRCGQAVEGESNGQCEKLENPADVSHQKDEKQNVERLHSIAEQAVTENVPAAKKPRFPLRNFDLSVDLNVSTNPTAILPEASLSSTNIPETKHEEYLGWSLPEIEKMAIDHMQLANLNRSLDEEDYDEEDS